MSEIQNRVKCGPVRTHALETNNFNFNLHFQVIVQEEYLIYPFESFVADVGGYLGLLLGASILSLVESSTNIIARFVSRGPDTIVPSL